MVQEDMLSQLDSIKATLLKKVGVIAVGIGVKERRGEFTEEISIRVFVDAKRPLKDIAPEDVIPPIIEGFKTDVILPYVIQEDAFVEREDTHDYRPIKGGIAIGSKINPSPYGGTLGWFGKLADNTPILLTNKHVLYDSTLAINTTKVKVGQHTYSSCCCCDCGVIGESIIGIKNATVDCAIAKINSSETPNLVITNGATSQTLRVRATAAAVVNGVVRKIGARSGFTTGKVVHIGDAAVAPTDPAGGAIAVQPDQIIIIPDPTETYEIENGKKAFSNSGDSGSIVLDANNDIVGLNWGGIANSNSVRLSIANNISNVLSALSTNGFPITLSASPPGGGDRRTVSKPIQTLDENASILNSLPSEWRSLVQYHRREVLTLINHNRAVKVVWHRHQGPAFTVHFMNSAKDDDYKIPSTVKDISLQTLLIRMGAVLKENGSDALREDINQYGLDIINHAENMDSVLAIINKFKTAALA